MLFSHSPQLRNQFPQLSVATLSVTGLTSAPDVAHTTRPFLERATARLAQRPESEFPEIAAWRRAFSQMGLKPTQYRCASEALLRRFRKDGSPPWIHPLVDVCNAVSLAYAIPIAMADRRGHQVLISSTSVRTSLGASGCDKSKHQRAETKHGNQNANDQIVAAVPHRMQDHHGDENTNSDKDGASAMRRTADPSDCRH